MLHQQATNTLLLGREIVRLKEVLELCVLLSEQLLAIVKTERYDWPQLNRRTCFSPFKPYLLLRETQYLCCENVTMAYHS